MPINHEPDEFRLNPYQAPHSSTPAPRMARDLLAMGASFLVICVLGCAFIFRFWMNLDLRVGLVRCIGFVVIMGGVHFVWYRMWTRQRQAVQEQNPVVARGGKGIWSRKVPYGLFWLLLLFLGLLLLWSVML